MLNNQMMIMLQNVLLEAMEITDNINEIIKTHYIPYEETEEVRQMRELHATCHICEKNFKQTENNVVDYDNLTGDVREIAHKYCVEKFDLKNTKILIFFHNFKGYDSHHIIKELGEFINEIGSEHEI